MYYNLISNRCAANVIFVALFTLSVAFAPSIRDKMFHLSKERKAEIAHLR